MIRLILILINIIWFWKHISCQVCPSGDIKQNGRNIYFLSNEQVDANTAKRACNSWDGNLVSFADSQVERKVMNYIEAKYLAGLQNVWGFHNTNHKNTRYGFSSSLPGWQRWSGLGKFKLYSRATRDYNQTYVFCTDQRITRGTLATRSVADCLYVSNYMTLYGGNEETARTIPLYNWKNVNDASRLSRSDYPFGNFVGVPLQLNNFIRRQSPVYLPDIHVFIGAHSNVNQTQWFWSDQRIVTNAIFPAANPSSCQQIALRYLYNDTSEQWINTAQTCNNAKAYFVCETIIEFSVNVTPSKCDKNSLNISWKLNDELKSSQNIWIIQISLDNSLYATVNASYETYMIKGLEPITEYNVKVTLNQNGCFNFNYSQTIKARTELGTPGPVQAARVRNSNNNSSTAACIVEWKQSEYDLYKQSHLKYQISLLFSSSLLFNVSHVYYNKTDDTFSHIVDLENLFLPSEAVTFQIAAETCQGVSSFVDIDGTCSAPSKHKSSFTTDTNLQTGSVSSTTLSCVVSENSFVSPSTIIIIMLSGMNVILIGIMLYTRKKCAPGVCDLTSKDVSCFNWSKAAVAVDKNQENKPKVNKLSLSPDSAINYVNASTLYESISPTDAKKKQKSNAYENIDKINAAATDPAYEII